MELDNRLKGQYCPGEEACSETATFPFFEDEIEPASPEAEERCKTCQLRETKPGTEDPELTAWIARALDIDLMKNSGGSFDVDSLTIWDWAAVQALTSARDREQLKENRRREREQDRQQRGANLLAKTGRRQ